MTVKVSIPSPLRTLTDEKSKVDSSGNTLKEVIDNLDSQYNGIKKRICDENGNIRPFINVFINGNDVRHLSDLDSIISAGDEITIVPAMAGGYK
ncbi:MAG: molybdopterin synthase sulfur carrier subunit [Actinobacteria bacterium]|jgi:molybdopterin synthase sulfur carrier subunit|nr:molybdopterin synthase sulfur carrier subunit [Actinomycetota bacterium]|tara:strand:+ start:560 stop:841 length:282 start_codon:yes stop_codon:yes gene_type:complete